MKFFAIQIVWISFLRFMASSILPLLLGKHTVELVYHSINPCNHFFIGVNQCFIVFDQNIMLHHDVSSRHEIDLEFVIECSIEDQLQTLSMLEADQWTRLSQSEQQAVLQTIADIETGRLGIPDVSIRIEDLRTGARGHYAHSIRTVSINSDYIQNPDVAKTVLHEVYHAFQFSLVEAYEAVPPEYKSLQIFESARTYRFELSNYIDAYLNYDQYVKQQCERDCRDYSQDRWADYIRILSW